MELLIDEIIHLTIGLIIGLLGFLYWRDKKLILLSVTVSLFLDLDHLIDYWLYLGYLDFNPWQFFTTEFFTGEKMYIIFHGYEYGLILMLLGLIFKKYRSYFFIAGLALFGHLFFDWLSYNLSPFNYSVIYRFFSGFVSPCFGT